MLGIAEHCLNFLHVVNLCFDSSQKKKNHSKDLSCNAKRDA
jgi:hypothetical protein